MVGIFSNCDVIKMFQISANKDSNERRQVDNSCNGIGSKTMCTERCKDRVDVASIIATFYRRQQYIPSSGLTGNISVLVIKSNSLTAKTIIRIG